MGAAAKGGDKYVQVFDLSLLRAPASVRPDRQEVPDRKSGARGGFEAILRQASNRPADRPQSSPKSGAERSRGNGTRPGDVRLAEGTPPAGAQTAPVPQDQGAPASPDVSGIPTGTDAVASQALIALFLGQQPRLDGVAEATEPVEAGPALRGVNPLLGPVGLPVAAMAVQAHLQTPVSLESAPTVIALSTQIQPQAEATDQTDVSSLQLDAFAAQVIGRGGGDGAVAGVRGEAPPVETASGEEAVQPTFRQMVSLMANGGSGEQGGQGPAEQEPPFTLKTDMAKGEEVPKTPVGGVASSFTASLQEAGAPAPGAQDAPLRHVEADPVIRQVTQFARVIVREGQSEARLQLHPEHLGQVQIKLVVAEGMVKAHLTVTDHSVKMALDSNLEQFRLRMAEQGLQVSQVEVSVGAQSDFHSHGRGQQFQSQHPGQSAQEDASPFSGDAPAEGPDTPVQPALIARRGVGGRLNSLA